MESKHLLQLALGSFSIMLGNILVSKFDFSAASAADTLLTFLIGFFLVFMGGILWLGTGIGIIKET